MGLANLNVATAANQGRVMPVLHPEDRTPLKGEGGSPVTITLLGKDSDAFIKAERKQRNKSFENLTRKAKFSAAENDAENDAVLAACTTAWSAIPQGWIDGTESEAPAEFTVANATALYGNPGVRWLREQVDEFIGTRANFLKASSAT